MPAERYQVSSIKYQVSRRKTRKLLLSAWCF